MTVSPAHVALVLAVAFVGVPPPGAHELLVEAALPGDGGDRLVETLAGRPIGLDQGPKLLHAFPLAPALLAGLLGSLEPVGAGK